MENTDRVSSRRYECGYIDRSCWTPGHPLHIEGCLIVFCECGEAGLTVNSRNFRLTNGSLGLIGFDMVAVPADISVDFKARFLSIDFEETQNIYFLITSNRFWDFMYKSPVSVVAENLLSPLVNWFDLVEWMSNNCRDSVKDKVLGSEAEVFMLNVAQQVESRFGVLGLNPSKNRAWTLINDFIGLLGRHYASHHNVAFYAERLNVTPNYLNIITRRLTGTTAKEQIYIQIGLVAKMLLDTTDLSVKQIAARLYFDDPSYLCRIFRKQTGMSPIQYRNKMRLSRNNPQ